MHCVFLAWFLTVLDTAPMVSTGTAVIGLYLKVSEKRAKAQTWPTHYLYVYLTQRVNEPYYYLQTQLQNVGELFTHPGKQTSDPGSKITERPFEKCEDIVESSGISLALVNMGLSWLKGSEPTK